MKSLREQLPALKAMLPKAARRRLGRYKRRLLPAALAPRSAPPSRLKPVTASRPAKSVAAPAAALAPPPPPKSRLEVRREAVFTTADPAGTVLEIGPAHNAILPKREGYRTKTVDYLDRAGLVEKYRDFTHYSPESIEEVDFVLPPGASMSDVISERFDVVLASHVIEHTTSLVHFVNECTKLLADGGALALVVPDHRYCFDRFRERTSLSRVIDASVDPPAVHTVGTIAEFILGAVNHRGTTSWHRGHKGTYSHIHDLESVKAKMEHARNETYIDAHNWVFSPHHMRLLMHDLYDLGLVSVREAYFCDTVGHEFFLNLTVDGPGPGLSREELLVLSDDELRTRDVPVFRGPLTAT